MYPQSIRDVLTKNHETKLKFGLILKMGINNVSQYFEY